MKIIKIISKAGLILFGIFICFFFIRLLSPSQLDDVSPRIYCEEELMNDADIYYVIPKFEGSKISDNKNWCKNILDREKGLEMHGIYHSYKEFEIYRDEEYFKEGINIFEKCFGFSPEKFKPGQLILAKENNWIKEKVEVDLFWNQVFHKVYHCGDTGLFPNWLIRIF
jgi:hypothetical protein